VGIFSLASSSLAPSAAKHFFLKFKKAPCGLFRFYKLHKVLIDKGTSKK
jgi:hypothetical protein